MFVEERKNDSTVVLILIKIIKQWVNFEGLYVIDFFPVLNGETFFEKKFGTLPRVNSYSSRKLFF